MSSENKGILLLVEDEPIIAISERRDLERMGYQVVPAGSGEEAALMIERGTPVDLVLMDIDLGKGMDGTEAAQRILKSRKVPIVFLSSHSDTGTVEKTEKITSYGYVVKNSGIIILDASIKMALKLFEANRKLSFSEKMLKEAESIAMSGSYTLDIPAGAWESSAELDAIFGIGKDYARSIEGWASLIHPEDRTMMLEYFSGEVLGKGRLFDREYRIVRECDRAERWVHGLGRLECDARGSPVLMYGMIQDITERKKVERNYIDSEEKFRLLSGKALLGIYMFENGVLTYVNPRFADIFGYSPEEICGRLGMKDLIHPEDAADVQAAYLEGMAGKLDEASFECRGLRKDGSLVYVEVHGSMTGYQGQRSVIGTLVDSTGFRLAGEELRNQKNLLTSIISSSSEPIFAKDLDGKYHTINDAGAAILGYTAAQVIGRTDLELLGEEKGLSFRADDEYVISSGRSLTSEVAFLRGGEPIHFMAHKSPWRDDEGRIIGIIGVANDITTKKTEEAKVRTLLEEKELNLREVHHRIKNNMATINAIFNIQEGNMRSEEAREALNDTRNRLLSMFILNDKLYQSSNFSDVSVEDYLASLVDEILASFPNRGAVRVRKEIQDFALEPKIIQTLGLITNELITNIMKYAFPGDRSGEIEVSATLAGNRVSLLIRDDGIGIPATVDVEHSTGFGLLLVRELARQIGGTIRIDRENGTRVLVEFGFTPRARP
jgi:PAS domain S-box-containing protein